MTYIGKTILKKWLEDGIKPIIKPYKYAVVPRFGTTVVQKENDDYLYYLYISTTKWDYIGYSPFGNISIKKVERILGQIITDKGYGNGSVTLKIIPNSEYGTFGKEIKQKEEISEIISSFKKVFVEYYLPSFEKYSDPKNVLELWDSLETMGDKGLVFQDSHNYSKIIILSKMCNDEYYQKRVDETISFFQSEIDKGEDWMQTKLDVFLKVIKYLEKNEV